MKSSAFHIPVGAWNALLYLVLNCGFAAENGGNLLGGELGTAVVGVQTILLLLHIGQLSVAETEHMRIVQHDIGQTLQPGQK